MKLTFEQLRKIVELGTNVHLYLDVESAELESPQDDSNNFPDTKLIRMIEREAFKKPADYNNAGKPIMEKTIPGFRAEVGDIFQVYVEPVIADGGSRYWRIWRGEDGDISMRDWHVSVTRTENL